MLTRLAASAIAASLLFACAPAATSARAPREPGYLVIQPDVSVSRNAQAPIAKNVPMDERSDVMAEILAIPPGR